MADGTEGGPAAPAGLAENITVTLTKPIEANGERVSTLTLRDPELGGLKGVHVLFSHSGEFKFDLGDAHRLIAAMADIPPSSARRISTRDLLEFMPAILDFLGLARSTGRSSSKTSLGSSAGRLPN